MVKNLFGDFDKLEIFILVLIPLFIILAGYGKYSKINRANIEIETSDKIYYTLKETLMIYPDNGCIDFYDLAKEYNTKHCGHYTVRYLK